MAVSRQLGVQQLPIHTELEAPSIRRYQGDRFDLRLKLLEQFSCQTDSPIGVVSDRTIDQVYFHQHHNTSIDLIKHPAGDATG